MKNFFKILSLLIGFCILICACTKYQDDSFISIQTTTQRLTKKNWQLKSIKINGIDSTSNFTFASTQTTTPLPILYMDTDGDSKYYTINDTRDNGDFTLDNGKNQMSFNSTYRYNAANYPNKDYIFPFTPTVCTILELNKSIFKISMTVNGNYYELTFNIL